MKRIKMMTLVSALMVMLLAGGCAKDEDSGSSRENTGYVPEWNGFSSESTEAPEPEATEAPENVNTESPEESQTKAVTVQFERKIDSQEPIESATVCGLDEAGEVVWTYLTGNYDMTELERITEIGVYSDTYYLAEGGSIVAIQVSDGEILWKNDNFGGASPSFAFGENGDLFVSGYYGPDLFVVDVNGNTVIRVESFDQNYYWPSQVVVENGTIMITMQGGANGEVICNVIHGDYENYYFTDTAGNVIGEEIVPGVDPGDGAATEWLPLTWQEVCDQVVTYYNNYFGTTDFVAFDTECLQGVEGLWVTLRTTGRADANVYVADVFVNMVTGEVEDPWGENWYLN